MHYDLCKKENSHLNPLLFTFAPQIKKETNGFSSKLTQGDSQCQRSRLPQCRYPECRAHPIRRYLRRDELPF